MRISYQVQVGILQDIGCYISTTLQNMLRLLRLFAENQLNEIAQTFFGLVRALSRVVAYKGRQRAACFTIFIYLTFRKTLGIKVNRKIDVDYSRTSA